MLYNPFYNFKLKLKKEVAGFKLIKYQSSYTAKNECFFYQLFFQADQKQNLVKPALRFDKLPEGSASIQPKTGYFAVHVFIHRLT